MKTISFTLSCVWLMCLCSCTLNEDSIRQTHWKCCGGEPVMHDFIEFTETNLRNDTIYGKTLYHTDTAIAVIFKTEKRWHADNTIYIKILSDGRTGRYCDKGNWKKQE